MVVFVATGYQFAVEIIQRVKTKSVACCWKKVNCLALQHLFHLVCIISRPIPIKIGSNQCNFYCLMLQKNLVEAFCNLHEERLLDRRILRNLSVRTVFQKSRALWVTT